jgi:hypothetical protein
MPPQESSEHNHFETTALLGSQDSCDDTDIEDQIGTLRQARSSYRKAAWAILWSFLALMVAASMVKMGSVYGRNKNNNDNNNNNEKVVYIIRHGEKIYRPSNETAYKYACLSQEGYSRAYNLVNVFGDSGNSKHGLRTPGALFSFNYDNGGLDCQTPRGYYRTQATLVPLAASLGLEIDPRYGAKADLCGRSITNNHSDPGSVCHFPKPGGSPHDFGPCCNGAASKAIQEKLFGTNNNNNKKNNDNAVDTVLVAWEHANVPYLIDVLVRGDDDNKDDDKNDTHVFDDWSNKEFDIVVALYFDARSRKFKRIDTTLRQGFEWIGPKTASVDDASYGLGEMPGVDR